jgi:transcription elongation factor Elf1
MGETMLRIICPHCSNTEEDSFEVLDANEVHAIKCGLCLLKFSSMIFDCRYCEHEDVLTWKMKPSDEGVSRLMCVNCGRERAEEEAGIEDGFE